MIDVFNNGRVAASPAEKQKGLNRFAPVQAFGWCLQVWK